MSSAQSQVELLSAYLDGELSTEESTRVEALLEDDADLRRQLAGLRSVSYGLGHLERLAPPPTLGQDVARRIALAGEKRSLLDRIEGGLAGGQRQSHILLMFALVLALATILYFFSHGLEQSRLTPVIFDDPAGEKATGENAAESAAEIESASTIFVAERLFQRRGEVWVEDGLDDAEVASARRIDLDRSALLEAHPELRGAALLGRAVLRLDGEVVELVAPDAEP